MLVESPAGLFCPAGAFHIDPWQRVDRTVITHAHGDHARPGSAAYLCAPPSVALLQRRFGPDVHIEALPYGEPIMMGGIRVSLHPAGHVLGAAQVRIEGPAGVWVVSCSSWGSRGSRDPPAIDRGLPSAFPACGDGGRTRNRRRRTRWMPCDGCSK